VDIPEFIYRLAVRSALIYRKLSYGYTFRRIPLTQGKYAIVDAEDYEQLIKYNWALEKAHKIFYASRKRLVSDVNFAACRIKMHRQIMNDPESKFIDHINHNGLDNRRANLRPVNGEQNSWNRRKRRRQCTSPYKGVYFDKESGKWGSSIRCKGKQIIIDWFEDEESAAKAYDEKAKELFGQYACLNFP
jgi:hypothetical protein